jgi:lipid-A-disaccharide synthase-like uncharacterized protein
MLTNLLSWVTLNHIWLAIGFVAQGLFASRFFVQWIASEKAKSSVVPVSFWYLSLVGSLMLLGYAIHKRDPVFILGQSTGFLIYVRNLFLIRGSQAGPRPATAD